VDTFSSIHNLQVFYQGLNREITLQRMCSYLSRGVDTLSSFYNLQVCYQGLNREITLLRMCS
jgi:hypothetical protein